ncbi:hypothetical protein DFJ77DRAFT_480439 [Powellomyces hirtus]|nr:hypothetical protein DFJ77DRAFT_480439 [Powellomyces hirtus]
MPNVPYTTIITVILTAVYVVIFFGFLLRCNKYHGRRLLALGCFLSVISGIVSFYHLQKTFVSKDESIKSELAIASIGILQNLAFLAAYYVVLKGLVERRRPMPRIPVMMTIAVLGLVMFLGAMALNLDRIANQNAPFPRPDPSVKEGFMKTLNIAAWLLFLVVAVHITFLSEVPPRFAPRPRAASIDSAGNVVLPPHSPAIADDGDTLDPPRAGLFAPVYFGIVSNLLFAFALFTASAWVLTGILGVIAVILHFLSLIAFLCGGYVPKVVTPAAIDLEAPPPPAAAPAKQ